MDEWQNFGRKLLSFQREQEGGGGGVSDYQTEGGEKTRPGKRAWVLDGLTKLRKNYSKDERASFPSSVEEKPDEDGYAGKLVTNPVGEGADARQIKRKLHPNGTPTDFFVDKVVAENIKKQLSRFTAKKPEVDPTDEEIEATRLPADKADLEKIFPKSWCDQYGDIVLDVVRKEFKDHMREMGNQRQKHNKFEDQNFRSKC